MAGSYRAHDEVIDSVTGVKGRVSHTNSYGVTVSLDRCGERLFTWREAYSRLRRLEADVLARHVVNPYSVRRKP